MNKPSKNALPAVNRGLIRVDWSKYVDLYTARGRLRAIRNEQATYGGWTGPEVWEKAEATREPPV